MNYLFSTLPHSIKQYRSVNSSWSDLSGSPMIFCADDVHSGIFPCKISFLIACFRWATSTKPRWNFVALITSLLCRCRCPDSAGSSQMLCTVEASCQFSFWRWSQHHFESFVAYFFPQNLVTVMHFIICATWFDRRFWVSDMLKLVLMFLADVPL